MAQKAHHQSQRSGRLLSVCFLALLLLFGSCGSADKGLRIEGRFKNLNQGEFYIYDADRGWKDTIAVRDGRFTYSVQLKDTCMLFLIFPNFSEMPVFAHSGAKISIEGDASHLRETEIKGTKTNEAMTAFRLRANNLTPPEVINAASDYIGKNPSSPVSLYLLRHYFILTAQPDYEQARKLCQQLLKARPDDGTIVRLSKQLELLAHAAKDSKLPAFTATDTDGKTVSSNELRSDVNVIVGWASWNVESCTLLRVVKKVQKKHADKMSVMSISVDASSHEAKLELKRDSITWPNICDGKMWQSPVVQQLGFASVPSSIIADKNGKIVARNVCDAKEMESQLESLLKN